MNFELEENKKELMRAILEKALSDNQYKERLLQDTLTAIKEVHPDFYIAEGQLEIVDQTAPGTLYLNISPLSYTLFGGDFGDIELTPEQLEAVAGGLSCYLCSTCDCTKEEG